VGWLDRLPALLAPRTPSSRFGRHYNENDYVKAGARVITYDRPSYGGSDRHRACASSTATATSRRSQIRSGIERLAVTGGSGDGPHALAVAARMLECVTRAACAVSPAPRDVDFDWFTGMEPLNVQESALGIARGGGART
jgi:pimeloyl-ACP methyl ester carboxylesterase